jgi:hypothetical protein
MNHEVDIQDGAEYEGETYIRCRCGAVFDDGHKGLSALLAFLREHEAIP